MKYNIILIIASLLSIFLMTIHLADDIVRGFEKGNIYNFIAVPIFVVWLYGTLMLPGRRAGYIIILLGSLLGLAVPIVHMMGNGVGEIAKSGGGFFFVWTIIELGITALFSIVLSVRGLWSFSKRKSPATQQHEPQSD